MLQFCGLLGWPFKKPSKICYAWGTYISIPWWVTNIWENDGWVSVVREKDIVPFYRQIDSKNLANDIITTRGSCKKNIFSCPWSLGLLHQRS